MAKTKQEGRLLLIKTPLGDDYLLLNKMNAQERISELYKIDVELYHDEEEDDDYKITLLDVPSILGQQVQITVDQVEGPSRNFHGIVSQIGEMGRNRQYSVYNATIVPNVWKTTQTVQSRIFQHLTIPDILEKVLADYEYKMQVRREYKPREFCVQYRESDFAFISRLMEEEGIYFYFDHTGERETIIIRDDYTTPEDVPELSNLPIHSLDNAEDVHWEPSVLDWHPSYNLRSGKVTFWDYNSQLPNKKLESTAQSRFNVGGNREMEIYDFPAGYAMRYDGIDKTGNEQTSNLKQIFVDNKTTSDNRMLDMDSRYRAISAKSDCCTIVPGYRFALKNHPNREFNIQYIVISATHTVEQSPNYLTDSEEVSPYSNEFTCIPHGEQNPEFRPEKKTPKPVIHGNQTAFVVGPEDEEIFTDKYGRVKVQFHWDRDGQLDANSSCWVPVSQTWAGNKWGMVFLPRIGMEVIVGFLEGDPDRPWVEGCVYNPGAMPPYDLPDEKTKSTIKSDSSPDKDGFNEFRIEDKKDSEQIFIHGEKDIDIRNKNDRREYIGNDQHYIVENDRRDRVKRDEHRMVDRHQYIQIAEDRHTTIGGNDNAEIGGSYSLKVGSGIEVESASHSHQASGSISLKAGATITLDAPGGVNLKCGGSFVAVTPAGVDISGPMVKINSGGSAGSATAPSIVAPTKPEEPDPADDAQPGTKIKLEKQSADRKEKTHKEGNEEKKSWVKIKLVDEEGNPVPGVSYKVTTPDGRTASGSTDKEGKGEVKNIDPGNCKITFPKLDKEAWEEG